MAAPFGQTQEQQKQELLDFGFKCGKNQRWYWDGEPDQSDGIGFESALRLLVIFKDLEKHSKSKL